MSTESWGAEKNWQEALGGLRNTVRQELVSQQLAEHLPPAGEDVAILDVGCGQGTQLLGLAREGYSVTGLDLSSELLELAEHQLGREDPEVRERVRLVQGDINELGNAVGRTYDVVLCHGLIMYLSSLDKALEQLDGVVAMGGILSTLTRNRYSLAMRAGMKGQYKSVVEDIDEAHYRNGLGVENVRGDEPQEVVGVLSGRGYDPISWYGVRLFSDHLPDTPVPGDIDELIAAELSVGQRDPYRQVCALTHVIGQKHQT